MRILGAVVLIVAFATGILYKNCREPYYNDMSIEGFKNEAPWNNGRIMKSIQAFENGDVKIVNTPIPKPEPGYVLIKMKRAPINPSDVYNAFERKGYGDQKKTWPVQVGFEGSGVVVGSGGGFLGYLYARLNVRVAAAIRPPNGGSWGEYAVAKAMEVLPITKDTNFEAASSAFVNPLTVLSMINIAEKENVKTIVNTAGSSALGLQLHRTASKYDIKVLSVVRGEKNVKILSDAGVSPENIIRSDTDDFQAKLKRRCEEENALIAFDAIAGEMSGTLLKNLPKGGQLWAYGRLSGESPVGVEKPGPDGQRYRGYLLVSDYLESEPMTTTLKFAYQVRSMLNSELSTSFEQVLSMEEVPEHVKSLKTHQRGGKALISLSS